MAEFATPLSGREVVHAVQRESAEIGSDAQVPAFQQEGGFEDESELMDEITKSGRILAYGFPSQSFELTLFAADDQGQRDIREAKRKREMLKVWEIETKENSDGEYNALFAWVLVETVGRTSAADGFVEFETTFQVFGEAVEDVLTELPPGIEEALYEFEKPGDTGTETTT